MSPLNFIDEIDKRFNKGIYQLVEEKKNNIEVLVEKSIAFVPWLLFKTYSALESKDNLNKFCICINYASRLFPNKRFHIHTDAGEVKTFCWNNNAYSEFNFQDVSSNYDLTSPFVGLLDLFYRINEIKTGGQDNFSMNKYLETRTDISRQNNVCIDESEYKEDVLRYLQKNYVVENVNYNRYAAYLWIATGDIQGNPLLQKGPNSETDKLLLEVLELMASNNTVLPKWTTFKGNNSYIQYNIPIFGFDNDVVKVVCNIVIPSLIKFSEETLSAISLLSNLWISKIWDYENNAWANANAVRASIAQVMARNMSHNFGSHVLSNLIGDDVYDKLRDVSVKKDLENFKRYTSISEWDNDVFKNDGKNRQLPFFFQYLKSRMDYLSEVTFGVSNLLTTKMMRSDVMKELDQVRILLNYISGVSNFKYIFKLQLPDNDIGVAFPSDVLGCQAFYNIIENIIRNTAKHAKNKNGETVTFTITIKDNFAKEAGCEDIEGVDELYCVEIDNGVTEDNIDVLVNGEWDEEKKIIIKEGQNTRLNESVLEGQNLRSRSLGLLEMEASAAFLRQIDLPEIESDDYTVDLDDRYYHKDSKGKKRLNILKAFAIDVKDEERTKANGEFIKVKTGRLGYRFFMQKPKEFLFIGEWGVTKEEEKKKQLLNYGIQFLTEKEFCTAMQSEKAFAHQFLIYPEEVSVQVKEYLKDDNDCRTLLPLRKLSISIEDKPKIEDFWTGEENVTIIGKQVLQSLKEFAWYKYFEKVVINQMKNCQKRKCNILGQINRENENNQVVFLDHGNFSTHDEAWRGSTKFDRTTGQLCILQGAKDITEKEIWIENLSSRTQGKLPLFNNYCHPKEEQVPQAVSQASHDEVTQYIKYISSKPQIIYEIFEAYHNKIVVIDERVQKFAMKNKEGSGNDEMIRSIDLHESTNVHIPRLPSQKDDESEDVFSLDPTDFSELKTKVVAYVDKRINGDNNKPIILIHYGVLERMCGGKVDEINEILKAWTGEGKAKRVVVTSGRGSHSLDLPKSVCFVNLSSVLYAFNENRNKYIINNLLNQSRRKRHE